VPLGVGVEEVVGVRSVLIDAALDQAKPQDAVVEVEVLLGVPGDSRDVVDAVVVGLG
jgi:hypothetical protein